MCFYSSAKVPTPSLRKHIRKRGCVHVIFLDGERQKAGEGPPLAVKFYVMFTCQSKGPSEMKAVITTGSRDFSAPDADGSRLTGGSPPLSDPADLRERGDANWASFLVKTEKNH